MIDAARAGAGWCELSSDQSEAPQSRFDDLYTAVYALIDDAKTRHELVKLYKGSHGSPDPHPVVCDYGKFFATHRRGVLGYACDRARPGAEHYRVADLDEFDRCTCPRVPTRAVFQSVGGHWVPGRGNHRRLPHLPGEEAASPRWVPRGVQRLR